jgi:hypothetical protein
MFDCIMQIKLDAILSEELDISFPLHCITYTDNFSLHSSLCRNYYTSCSLCAALVQLQLHKPTTM